MVHVSTDYVFHGLASLPYAEDAATSPISVYGQSKLEGELAVFSALPSAVVLRTSWVFSQFGNNFLKTMLRLGQEQPELRIVADQLGGPSYAVHIARTLLMLAQRMQESPRHHRKRGLILMSHWFRDQQEFTISQVTPSLAGTSLPRKSSSKHRSMDLFKMRRG